MRGWLRAAACVAALVLAPTLRAGASDEMAVRMQACTPCHGEQGRASGSGYQPRIAGKPAGYLFNQLVHFRDGRRKNTQMAGLVEHLGDASLREIAQWFAQLDLPHAAPTPLAAAPTLLALGERLARQGDATRGLPACSACHGERLTGVQPALPGLIGLPRDYLIGQLGAWRNGDRRADAPDCMAQIVQRLTPSDIEALTLWLANQPPAANMAPAPAPASATASTSRAALPLRCGGLP